MRKDFLTGSPTMVLWHWLADRIGLVWSTEIVCLGRVVENEIVGVVGFNNFTGTSCHMHMAGEGRWINRNFLYTAFGYPFQHLGLTMVFGVVPSGNIQSVRVCRKLGFEELVYIPEAHPDGGLHILQMRREQCRWLRDNHGKEVYSNAA